MPPPDQKVFPTPLNLGLQMYNRYLWICAIVNIACEVTGPMKELVLLHSTLELQPISVYMHLLNDHSMNMVPHLWGLVLQTWEI